VEHIQTHSICQWQSPEESSSCTPAAVVTQTAVRSLQASPFRSSAITQAPLPSSYQRYSFLFNPTQTHNRVNSGEILLREKEISFILICSFWFTAQLHEHDAANGTTARACNLERVIP